ncbi:hypothetical protein C8P68_105157 [Mucilaginibacter yixingensis]|uniref:Outer membrane protein with beta-barrel domain n=1 Tax=Mucilaginibacter yixingensis TaxID=1295612 RepID=A0A2T5J893_9SPHI|nr:hypothetical protein [Mucilaginibacter yixingensis]PTQ95652.1 hypothetical protein C8P68_105157 [Mucilaginibacter yixingensis]
MQKITLTLAFIICVLFAKAQTQKGTLYLGGSVSYLTQKTNGAFGSNTTNRQLEISPTIGKFINEHWAIGITPMYSYMKDTAYVAGPGYSGGSIVKRKMIGGGLEVRYYFQITDKFSFFPLLSESVLASFDSKDPMDIRENIVSLSPNFAFFPTRHIAINISLGSIQWITQSITDHSTTPENKTTGSLFSSSFNSGLGLGAAYHF